MFQTFDHLNFIQNSKFKIQNSAGFTLFELLLVVTILGIMATALFSNANAGQATLAAQRSSQLIVQAIREAQNSALGAKVAGSPPGIPAGGWGVSFHAGSDPILFADVNGNHQYDPGTDVLVRTIALDNKAPITALSSVGATGNLDIAFLAPNPNIYINGVLSAPDTPDATVTVTGSVLGNVVKTIHVNAIGAIGVQ